MSPASTERVWVFGCPLDALTMDQTVDRVDAIVSGEGPPVQHVVLNASKVVMMHDDPALLEAVRSCGLINADGQSVVWACRMLGRRVPERVAGIDLFMRLAELAARKGYPVYLLGARPEVVREVADKLVADHPGLVVAGIRDGYYTPEQIPEMVAGVRASGARMLFVAMPSPRKEFFLAETLPDLGVPFAMGVGGSFDVVAGVTSRAPAWMQHSGLEWFYRFTQEPGRMWRRYLVGNARFIGILVVEMITRRGEKPVT